MATVIDAYDAGITRSQHLTHIHSGSSAHLSFEAVSPCLSGDHLYYKYMSHLIHLTLLPRSLLATSFGYKRGIVQPYFGPTSHDSASSLALSLGPSSIIDIRATSAVPEDVWDEVFDHLPHETQLQARSISLPWHAMLTRRTHHYLVLSLPDRWVRIMDDPAVKGDLVFLREFTLECEIDLSAAIVHLGLQGVVQGICLLNWPIFTYNFFFAPINSFGDGHYRG